MITDRDLKFFDVARAAAQTSRHHKAHIGAVLVSSRDIVAVGVNGKKSHPLQLKYNRLKNGDSFGRHLLHAELEALVRGRRFITGDTAVYVYRVMKDGRAGIARPCRGCIEALLDFGVRTMYYSTQHGLACEELRNAKR